MGVERCGIAVVDREAESVLGAILDADDKLVPGLAAFKAQAQPVRLFRDPERQSERTGPSGRNPRGGIEKAASP